MPFKTPHFKDNYYDTPPFPQDVAKEYRSLRIIIDDEVLKLPAFNMVSVVNEFDTYMIKNLPDVLTNKIVST